MVLFMIWKLHIMQILLNLLMLFWKEFVETYFPWLIIILYQIIISEKYIFIMPLHHQMMTIKGPLHMIFVYNTLMHWCMILASTTSSPSPSPRSCSFNAFKWRRGPVEDIFYHLYHVHSWGRIFPMIFSLFPHFTWRNKISGVKGDLSLSFQGIK